MPESGGKAIGQFPFSEGTRIVGQGFESRHPFKLIKDKKTNR